MTFSKAGTKQDNKAASYGLCIVLRKYESGNSFVESDFAEFLSLFCILETNFELALFISIGSIMARVSVVDSGSARP